MSAAKRSAIEATNTKCGTFEKWKYCVTPGTGSRANEVAYYFHGGGGDKYSWIDPQGYGALVAKGRLSMPTVISVSRGDLWLLSEKSAMPKSGWLQEFYSQLMPHLENEILKFKPAVKLAIGESMGGFNAATLALKNSNEFDKLILLCPGTGTEASIQSVDAYMAATGAKRAQTQLLFRLANDFYSSVDGALEAMPIRLLDRVPANSKLEIFVSSGDQDEFGFFKTAEEFARKAKSRGLKTVWYPAKGRHCSMNLEALIAFL